MRHDDKLSEIKQCLEMWGQWLRDGEGFRLGYPTSVNFAVKSGVPTLVYDESVAEAMEVCMCVLKDRYPNYYWALYYFYYWNLSQDQAAEKIKISRTKYKDNKKNGETWVDAFYLSGIFKKSA